MLALSFSGKISIGQFRRFTFSNPSDLFQGKLNYIGLVKEEQALAPQLHRVVLLTNTERLYI